MIDQVSCPVLSGRVRFFRETRAGGFGFIEREGKAYFFHRKRVAGFASVKTGDAVEFEVLSEPSVERGEARNVRVL